MKLIVAFLRLVRWPNMVIIAATQVLFYYSFVQPIYLHDGATGAFPRVYFILLVISSLLIAAAGNIINDYFDLNIDEINKPEKKIIDKLIKRRWAIVLHILFSITGVLLGFYVDFSTPVFWLGFSNLICAFLLFGYSISLKKKLLVGNILISLLTAWVILVCFFCYYRSFSCSNCEPSIWQAELRRFIRVSVLYAGFAFVISLIREVVKDMEDMDGDARYGCRTLPIAWGIPASKVFMIAERSEVHDQLFKENEEAVFFSTKEELLEKVNYYLQNKVEADVISNAGFERCMNSGYTHDMRLQEVLKKIKTESA